jgi:hypothetical protein
VCYNISVSPEIRTEVTRYLTLFISSLVELDGPMEEGERVEHVTMYYIIPESRNILIFLIDYGLKSILDRQLLHQLKPMLNIKF